MSKKRQHPKRCGRGGPLRATTFRCRHCNHDFRRLPLSALSNDVCVSESFSHLAFFCSWFFLTSPFDVPTRPEDAPTSITRSTPNVAQALATPVVPRKVQGGCVMGRPPGASVLTFSVFHHQTARALRLAALLGYYGSRHQIGILPVPRTAARPRRPRPVFGEIAWTAGPCPRCLSSCEIGYACIRPMTSVPGADGLCRAC